MKNQEQGSSTQMVGQKAHITQDLGTFLPPLTPSQAQRASRFLTMAGLGARLDAVPPPSSHEEARREGCGGLRPTPAAQPPQVPAEPEPPAWLITVEELEKVRRAPAVPRIVVQVELEEVATLEERLELEPYRPKRGRGAGTEGAGALARVLDSLARRVLQTRPYLYSKEGKVPVQVVLHSSGEMLAEMLGVSDNTVRAWTAQLTEAGYVQARPHYTTATTKDGQKVTMVDGTLYAVRLKAGHTARLRYRDLKREYRNLDADRAAGRTAHNAIRNARKRAAEKAAQDAEKNTSESAKTLEEVAMRTELWQQLQRWAVTPGDISLHPLNTDSEVFQPEEAAKQLKTVLDVVYALPMVAQAHSSKRAPLVGILAATLARALNDQHSRAFYCRLIWDAWNEEQEGRPGLQQLAAQLTRLKVDRREWAELRNPAALLVHRMRAV